MTLTALPLLEQTRENIVIAKTMVVLLGDFNATAARSCGVDECTGNLVGKQLDSFKQEGGLPLCAGAKLMARLCILSSRLCGEPPTGVMRTTSQSWCLLSAIVKASSTLWTWAELAVLVTLSRTGNALCAARSTTNVFTQHYILHCVLCTSLPLEFPSFLSTLYLWSSLTYHHFCP